MTAAGTAAGAAVDEEPRRFTAVVNPAAGRGAGANRLLAVARRLREAGADVVVEHSRGVAHAHDVAGEAAADGRVVVAVGGDGMLRCLAGPVVEAGGVLGVVPAGRGNDFARAASLPRDPADVATLLLHGDPRPTDVVDVDGTVVLGSVYAGVDSVANAHANRSRLLPPSFVYPAAGLRAISRWQPVRYDLLVDGEPLTTTGWTVVVANSGWYGGGMRIAPGASLDDGLLDLVLVGDGPRRAYVAGLRQLYDGTHVERAEVSVARVREVRIATDRPVPVYADGDPVVDAGSGPVIVRVRAGALRMLRPVPDPARAGLRVAAASRRSATDG